LVEAFLQPFLCAFPPGDMCPRGRSWRRGARLAIPSTRGCRAPLCCSGRVAQHGRPCASDATTAAAFRGVVQWLSRCRCGNTGTRPRAWRAGGPATAITVEGATAATSTAPAAADVAATSGYARHRGRGSTCYGRRDLTSACACAPGGASASPVSVRASPAASAVSAAAAAASAASAATASANAPLTAAAASAAREFCSRARIASGRPASLCHCTRHLLFLCLLHPG